MSQVERLRTSLLPLALQDARLLLTTVDTSRLAFVVARMRDNLRTSEARPNEKDTCVRQLWLGTCPWE